MLTVRFDRLNIVPGDVLVDLGCGFGRHAYEASRRGANVVALDYADDELRQVRATFAAMMEVGEISPDRFVGTPRGDVTKLGLRDGSVNHIVTSEVLEHIQNDVSALAEFYRILTPGGTLTVTVPTWLPEKICWMLSDAYHAPIAAGGHVRIYTATELQAKLRAAGFELRGSHHAHALHSPYWWIRCAVGPTNETHPLVVRYKKFLEADIISPKKAVRLLDDLLNPVLGKSLVLYAVKPASGVQGPAA
jgi:SAM-dependent methyltransferase